jgi:hypothetical protein
LPDYHVAANPDQPAALGKRRCRALSRVELPLALICGAAGEQFQAKWSP